MRIIIIIRTHLYLARARAFHQAFMNINCENSSRQRSASSWVKTHALCLVSFLIESIPLFSLVQIFLYHPYC